MGLDFVLRNQEHRYFATETEKLEYFNQSLDRHRFFSGACIYFQHYRRQTTTILC